MESNLSNEELKKIIKNYFVDENGNIHDICDEENLNDHDKNCWQKLLKLNWFYE